MSPRHATISRFRARFTRRRRFAGFRHFRISDDCPPSFAAAAFWMPPGSDISATPTFEG